MKYNELFCFSPKIITDGYREPRKKKPFKRPQRNSILPRKTSFLNKMKMFWIRGFRLLCSRFLFSVGQTKPMISECSIRHPFWKQATIFYSSGWQGWCSSDRSCWASYRSSKLDRSLELVGLRTLFVYVCNVNNITRKII